MATIKKRVGKDGRATYHVRVRLKGQALQCGTFPNITKAKEFIQATEAAMKEGRYFKIAEARKHTLSQLIDRYITDVLPRKPKSQFKQHAQLLWWRKKIGHCILRDVTPSLIAECRDFLLRGKTVRGAIRSPSTVVRYMAALSHAFTVAEKEWQWVDDSPVAKVSKPQEPRGRVRFLDDDERLRLLQACKESSNPYLYIIVVLALSTGMRQGEIMGLTWKDVDLEKGRIVLQETKNGEIRVVPLVGHALELLKEFFKIRRLDTSLLFPGKDPQKIADIRFAWEKALNDSFIVNFRFHDLRHTFASYLAMRKATLIELRTLLGHKSASMTVRYSHLSEAHGAVVVGNMTREIFGAFEDTIKKE
ncbi:MAG: site-specific integrase [Chlamydiae bacterium]|nr:site-specific integrase [Chlamydiota bacterium]